MLILVQNKVSVHAKCFHYTHFPQNLWNVLTSNVHWKVILALPGYHYWVSQYLQEIEMFHFFFHSFELNILCNQKNFWSFSNVTRHCLLDIKIYVFLLKPIVEIKNKFHLVAYTMIKLQSKCTCMQMIRKMEQGHKEMPTNQESRHAVYVWQAFMKPKEALELRWTA